MREEHYLDHAATSYPKPPEVLEAMQDWATRQGASAGRGDYPRAVETGLMIRACRESLARLLGCPDPDRVIFTLNCTDALNLALRGLRLRPGDRVVVGPTEHNSIMRPLHAMAHDSGIVIERLPGRTDGTFDLSDLEKTLGAGACSLVIIQHASNVLGAIHDIGAVGAICRARGVPVLVDAAQTAGSVPIDMAAMGISLLCVPGHKALQGPQGTGALLAAPGIDLDPWRRGGTGSRSEAEEQPEEWPDRMESGSHNAHGIAGLRAGVEWIAARGLAAIRRHEQELMDRFLDGIAPLEADGMLAILGPRTARERSPVVTIRVRGQNPRHLAAMLWNDFGIMSRPGLHCAPAAHRLAGTWPDGALRFSFGPLTALSSVEAAVAGLRSCIAPRRGARTR